MTNNIEPAVLEKDNGENEEFAKQLDEEVSKPLLTEIARKKHFREKFQKSEEARLKLEEELKTLKSQPVAEPPKSPQPEPGLLIEDFLELQEQGYSPAEIKTISAMAKDMKKRPTEVLNNPFIKSGIEAERAKAKVEQATPSPTNRSFVVKDKEWGQMTEAERKVNFNAFQEHLAKKQNQNK